MKTVDTLEILAEQLEAIGDLWDLSIANNLEENQQSRIEELLLSVFREKIEALKQIVLEV